MTFQTLMHRGATVMLSASVLLLALAGWTPDVQAQPGPVPEDPSVELIAEGFQFTEGPLWYDGRLVFADIPANTVYEWTEEGGSAEFITPSGHANGLAVDASGRLLLAQHDGQLGRRTDDGDIAPLVTSYEGKRLNSPNDLTVAGDGSIYFTDPPYGVDDANRELDFSGVYRFSADGTLTVLTKRFSRPNGICLSPDESRLYVNDSSENVVWVYDVTEDGGITNGQQFAAPRGDAEGNTDGMKVDADGNLYTTGPGGIWVYSPDGEQLGRISIPVAPTNLAFGGPDGRTLYVTARQNVYRVRVNARGAR